MIIWIILYWLSVILIAHSYLIYPWILQLLMLNKKTDTEFFTEDELPPLTVVMSVYNEEIVLQNKLDSILAADYPEGKLHILIGSDASNDSTNVILKNFAETYQHAKIELFENRRGKPAVINELVESATTDLLLLTDANVIFHKDVLKKLVRHFKDEKIGSAGVNLQISEVAKKGVSIQEKAFMTRENLMKYREGQLWGSAIGLEGAAYAIRKQLYTHVPAGFAVDDFFITMNVIRKGKAVIIDLEAMCYEEVPALISEEYRRQVRIASGNYTNMRYFAKELLRPWKGSSFAYISHKVIRWTGPFILILFMLSTIFLYNFHELYRYTFYGTLSVLSLTIIDFFLGKIGIHIVFLRFIRHFLTMNAALLQGFINYLGGRKQDVWQPTKR